MMIRVGVEMLSVIFYFGTFLAASFAAETICKPKDLNDCAKVIKTHVGDREALNHSFNEICQENKTFKCTRVTVRGNVDEEITFKKKENPKAFLFPSKIGEDNVILMIQNK